MTPQSPRSLHFRFRALRARPELSRRLPQALLSIFFILLMAACASPSSDCACAGRELRLATTTSVDSTGLLEVLLGPFTQRTGIDVRVLAVGTGQALKLGRNGDVDVLLVHDRPSELAFIDEGYGVNHRQVMHNDFVLVGPASDPASVRGMDDAAAAFRQIARQGALFVSRGDSSGTHKAELRQWELAGVQPSGSWYLEAGQGMRMTLLMAGEKQAYCLVDRGSFLDARPDLSLELMVQGDPRLRNPYSVIPLNPARFPDASYLEAMALVGWLSSAPAQAIIGNFTRDGNVLFYPDTVPATEASSTQKDRSSG